MLEMALWLKHPDIWIHDSENRTKIIRKDLATTLKKWKRESQWIPETKPEDFGEFSEAIMWLESPESFDGIEGSAYRTKTSLRSIFHQIKYYSKWIAPGKPK